MELHRTDEGFALYKEKTQIGFCALTPAAKGAAITAFGICLLYTSPSPRDS
mgnify:CR=1 FL=1